MSRTLSTCVHHACRCTSHSSSLQGSQAGASRLVTGGKLTLKSLHCLAQDDIGAPGNSTSEGGIAWLQYGTDMDSIEKWCGYVHFCATWIYVLTLTLIMRMECGVLPIKCASDTQLCGPTHRNSKFNTASCMTCKSIANEQFGFAADLSDLH